MKNKDELFSLWTASGNNKVIHISHKVDNGPISQGYPSKVSTYAFKED
jgi:hypothetical protein